MSDHSGHTLQVWECHGESPARTLALEERLLEQAAAGRPGLLVASWPGPVTVLGYAQPSSDVDLDFCRARGIPVLRRPTGGTGVVHRSDLGIGLALPSEHPWSRGIRELYDRFLDALLAGLAPLNPALVRLDQAPPARRERSPLCFEDQLSETLLVGRRKAVGCAQARRGRSVLVHAAVLLGLDAALVGRVFRLPPERVERALAPAATGVGPAEVGRSLVAALAAALALDPRRTAPPAPAPDHLARYRQPRWAPNPEPAAASRRNDDPDPAVGAVGTTSA